MLAWAKQPYACIIFNLHVGPGAAGVEKAKADFLRLIDRGLTYGGSYFLTYHRWARREQVLAAYPEIVEFLRLKRRFDPRRAVPERLVSPLPYDVRRPPVTGW